MLAEKNTEESAPYDARAIANLVLDKAKILGSDLTQMQLYKIIYFAHGWYLAAEGRKLVKQNFQAWSYGPVIGIVRDAFKKFGKNPITDRAQRLDIFTGEFINLSEINDQYDVDFVSKIVEFYHVFDGWALSDMTHEINSPWDKVWNSSGPVGNLGLLISDQSIKEHFSNMSRKFTLN